MPSRIRPCRRPRWRRYLAPGLLAALGALAVASPASATARIQALGLTVDGAFLLLAAIGVLIATVATQLVGRHGLVPLAIGGLAVSLGWNLASGRWIPVPMVVVGAVWLAGIEVLRVLDGIVIARNHVGIARALRSPLEIAYGDIRALHTNLEAGEAGALILETEHGTVTVRALPAIDEIQTRLEARLHAEPVEPTEGSLRQARRRIERLVRSGG